MNVLVLTPTQAEYDALLLGLLDALDKSHPNFKDTMFKINNNYVTLGIGGQGKVEFAINTTYRLLSGSRYDLVICAGTAVSLNERLQIGDLVFATKTIEHDFISKSAGKYELPVFPGSISHIAKFQAIRNTVDFGFKIYFGGITSGDEDITSTTRAREIAEKIRNYDVPYAVAWEGVGGAKACAFLNTPFLEIRGISGMVSNDSVEDFKENLKVIMTNFVEVLTKL